MSLRFSGFRFFSSASPLKLRDSFPNCLSVSQLLLSLETAAPLLCQTSQSSLSSSKNTQEGRLISPPSPARCLELLPLISRLQKPNRHNSFQMNQELLEAYKARALALIPLFGMVGLIKLLFALHRIGDRNTFWLLKEVSHYLLVEQKTLEVDSWWTMSTANDLSMLLLAVAVHNYDDVLLTNRILEELKKQICFLLPTDAYVALTAYSLIHSQQRQHNRQQRQQRSEVEQKTNITKRRQTRQEDITSGISNALAAEEEDDEMSTKHRNEFEKQLNEMETSSSQSVMTKELYNQVVHSATRQMAICPSRDFTHLLESIFVTGRLLATIPTGLSALLAASRLFVEHNRRALCSSQLIKLIRMMAVVRDFEAVERSNVSGKRYPLFVEGTVSSSIASSSLSSSSLSSSSLSSSSLSSSLKDEGGQRDVSFLLKEDDLSTALWTRYVWGEEDGIVDVAMSQLSQECCGDLSARELLRCLDQIQREGYSLRWQSSEGVIYHTVQRLRSLYPKEVISLLKNIFLFKFEDETEKAQAADVIKAIVRFVNDNVALFANQDLIAVDSLLQTHLQRSYTDNWCSSARDFRRPSSFGFE